MEGKNKNKMWIILGSSFAVLLITCLVGLIFTGMYVGWGPFAFMQFDHEEKVILQKYDFETRKGEIVFYGASNFRLWTEMENDLSEYKVQNHGFGGSTDKDLVERADTLLYPYAPAVVFFQTGSNDYVSLDGTDEEKVEVCMEYKRFMFESFHERLPDAKFVVMSGLLLPGRSQYTALTQKINDAIEELCAEYDYITFVDAEEMTFDGSAYRSELFIKDGIHLNHEGQLIWRDGYIKPAIEALIDEYGLEILRK